MLLRKTTFLATFSFRAAKCTFIIIDIVYWG